MKTAKHLHLEDLFTGSLGASSSYMPSSITRERAAAGSQTSVLLEQASAAQQIRALIHGATQQVQMLAVLPVDPEADTRIDQLVARQPRSLVRRPVPRK